jgi:hypothetical protein
VTGQTDAENADTQPSLTLPLTPLFHGQRVQMFGRFSFTPDPVPGNPEHVVLSHDWTSTHLVDVDVPQLHRRARVHSLIAPQFLALWAAWEKAGLIPLVLTFDGAWSSRFKRQVGSYDQRVAKCAKLNERDLSNHAWGTAFDINARWNALGDEPTLAGDSGSVRALVPLAEAHGFFWGGHFNSRRDGMHFEAARIIAPQAVA